MDFYLDSYLTNLEGYRIQGMAPHMAPVFIELLSRLQRPPSTRSLIANEAAMESSALALSGLRFEFSRSSRCGGDNAFLCSKLKRTLHLTLFLHLRPQPSQPPAPYGANTQPIMANEGSMESPRPPLSTDEPGAMMMHHHHHRLHIPTVETMLWSK